MLHTLAFVLGLSAWATPSLELIHYGWIDADRNGETVMVREYRFGYGDTTRQDQLANSPDRAGLGPFALNAATYFRNQDGTWNLFNFRLPTESNFQPVNDEQQRFIEYLKRADVRELLESPYIKTDFGSSNDFIYKKMGLTTADLPEPFRRFPVNVLNVLEMIMVYNADSTAKAYFKQPWDQEEYAVELFKQIVDAN